MSWSRGEGGIELSRTVEGGRVTRKRLNDDAEMAGRRGRIRQIEGRE